jgi:hypothetical protein
MRKLLITATILLLTKFVIAQKVYAENVASRADVKVYVETVESRADLVVYMQSVASRATGNSRVWYFENFRLRVDK